jgi:hypothetical protein
MGGVLAASVVSGRNLLGEVLGGPPAPVKRTGGVEVPEPV